ncbi:MAG TPA: hypothetical protein VGY58_01765 [Gemmataceae bacterium]|nr:hypothetical protein [Gemmataceae bacterium]
MTRPGLLGSALAVLLLGSLAYVSDGRGDAPPKKKASISRGPDLSDQGPANTRTAKKKAALQGAKAADKREPARAEKPAESLRQKLGEAVGLPNGIQPNTPLRDALEFIGDRHEVTILVDAPAFKEDGVENIEEVPVRLPRMSGIRLDTVLRALAGQIKGVPLLRPDHIEITTPKHAVETVWGRSYPLEDSEQPGRPRPMLPLVNVVLAKTSLDAALRELVGQTGISVILDSARAGERARTAVTAAFTNVPLDGAVRLLAEQADLQAVLVDNALYVTTRQRAQAMRDEQERPLSPGEKTPEMVLAQHLRQAVDVNLDDVALKTALAMIARETGIKVLIDQRAEVDAEGIEISMHLKDVSTETALRLTAEQANLRPVLVGDVFYITTEARAAKLLADQERALANANKALNNTNLNGLGAIGIGGGGATLNAGGLGALGGGLGVGGGMLGFTGGMVPDGSPKLIGPAAAPGKTDAQGREKQSGKVVSPNQAGRTPAFAQVDRKLTEVVTLKKGIEANTPLKDALEFLKEQYKLPLILVNTAAFKAEGVENVEDMPVKLPRLNAIRLGTVLQKIAAQVNGAFLVRVDHLELTTKSSREFEIWGRPQEDSPDRQRRLLPLTHAALEQRPLDEALRELASATGFNVVIDVRHAAERSHAAVTAILNNVPLDTAVRLLADEADLQALLLDDVLFVTTREQARALQLEHERLRRKGMDIPAALGHPAGM